MANLYTKTSKRKLPLVLSFDKSTTELNYDKSAPCTFLMDLKCMHDLVPAGITISGTTTDAWTPCGEPVHPAWDSSGEKKKLWAFAEIRSTKNNVQQLVVLLCQRCDSSGGYPERTVGVTPDMEWGPRQFSRSCHSESVSSVLLKWAPVRCSLCMLHCLLACSIGLAAKGDIWWLMCSHVPPLLWAADALHRQIGRGGWGSGVSLRWTGSVTRVCNKCSLL